MGPALAAVPAWAFYTTMATTVAAGMAGAYSQYAAGRTSARLANRQADLQAQSAKYEKERAEVERGEIAMQANQAAGAARAGYAGAGVDLGEGSALETPADIHWRGAWAQKARLTEGELSAYKLETEAELRRWEGKAKAKFGSFGAAGTLLSTGSSAVGMYGQYKGW